MALMKEKMKKYFKEMILFLVMLFIVSTIVSLYRTSTMNIKVDICQNGGDIVYFWASWCPVCKMTSPNIDHISSQYDVVTVAVKSGDENELRNYMQEANLHFDTINDNRGFIAEQNSISVFPTIVFCKDRKVKLVEAGYISTFGLWLRAWLFI